MPPKSSLSKNKHFKTNKQFVNRNVTMYVVAVLWCVRLLIHIGSFVRAPTDYEVGAMNDHLMSRVMMLVYSVKARTRVVAAASPSNVMAGGRLQSSTTFAYRPPSLLSLDPAAEAAPPVAVRVGLFPRNRLAWRGLCCGICVPR